MQRRQESRFGVVNKGLIQKNATKDLTKTNLNGTWKDVAWRGVATATRQATIRGIDETRATIRGLDKTITRQELKNTEDLNTQDLTRHR